jgi:site-specific DNA-methyltransferase (adenine-specific)
LNGDCREVMEALPADTFDCCMTSPPYWQKRQYESGGIGLEDDHRNFITEILRVTEQVRRVLKPSGSFWLNMGDSYENKRLLGLPWRVALRMCDEQGWILRSQVVWNKIKGGPDNSPDRLRNVHEPIFHFVKSPKYFFDADAVRSAPRQTKVVNGAVVSATGVSGVRYRRQIELSTDLSSEEKERAMAALDALLDEVRQGRCADFRMVIRRQQRATHSDSESLSGRAKELATKGFYFLRYHPNGAKPSDVWDILPEDTHREDEHFAPYPEDLCRIPILSTCPKDGLVLDPFCGTGTTNLAAYHLGRKSVGIDLSRAYLEKAAKRCGRIPATSSRRLPGSGCGRDPTV